MERAALNGTTWTYTPQANLPIGHYRLRVRAQDVVGNIRSLLPFELNVIEAGIEGLVALNDGPTALGEPATLSATITVGSNTTFTWDLGDGTRATGAEVTHTYQAAGEYLATVTARNRQGIFIAQTTVMVQEPIAGLTASNDGPTTLGEVTTFTATVAAGSNLTFTWELGDGSTATGAEVTHTYQAAGEYLATVTVFNQVSQALTETTVLVTVGEVPTSTPTSTPTATPTSTPTATPRSIPSDETVRQIFLPIIRG